MEIESVLSFLGASIVLSLMPGPDNILVLTESLAKGQKNGIAISFGLGVGILLHTIAAATGLSLIIQRSALVFSIIKYLGAVYLFYLAYQAYTEKKYALNIKSVNIRKKNRVLLLVKKGFLMNMLNPKVSLFFIAFLPQFIVSNGWSIITQMIVLGLIFMLQAVVIFSLVAMVSGKLTKYVDNPKFWSVSRWSKISILTLLGMFLALSNK